MHACGRRSRNLGGASAVRRGMDSFSVALLAILIHEAGRPAVAAGETLAHATDPAKVRPFVEWADLPPRVSPRWRRRAGGGRRRSSPSAALWSGGRRSRRSTQCASSPDHFVHRCDAGMQVLPQGLPTVQCLPP